MKTLLLYPPITDPTSGYHSLCYIETYARQHGFENIEILDVNIEAFLYSLENENVYRVREHIAMRKKDLVAKPGLTAYEQMELHHVLKSEKFHFHDLPQAVAALRDQNVFYDYSVYRPAAELLSNWLNVLSLFGYAGQFRGFGLPVRGHFNLMSSRDMSDHEVTSRIAAPFDPYYRDVLLPFIEENEYATIGINVTYCSQLPFALAVGRMIKQLYPTVTLLFGGTEVSDVWKYITDKERFFAIFDVADACVVGEGEKAFVQLLKIFSGQQPLEPVANALFHPKYKISHQALQIEYHDITQLPTPDYGTLNWERYLSPHPYVYYSPSRGCYWNKCTFCDYGLNFDSPTSPWRQSPLEKIIEDLREIAQRYKYIYFSVDVLSPALLLNLAERLIEEKIDIRWGAEIRLEKYWSPERCALLKSSGCTDISVGFESGNQRILNLIDKGTQIDRIIETIQNFHIAGIGVQMMGFTGFPTETLEEGLESVHFLSEHRHLWTFGGLGSFVLTPGAIVAKDPGSFGLSEVRPYQGEDISRQLYFENPFGIQSDQERNVLESAKQTLGKGHFDRPWAGGIDTGHTMFYHDHYGVDVIQHLQAEHVNSTDGIWKLNGWFAEDADGYRLANLFQEAGLDDLHREYNSDGRSLTSSDVTILLKQKVRPKNNQQPIRRLFVRTDGKVYPFPEPMLKFLELFEQGATYAETFANLPMEEHQVYLEIWSHSISHHFIRPMLSSSSSKKPDQTVLAGEGRASETL